MWFDCGFDFWVPQVSIGMCDAEEMCCINGETRHTHRHIVVNRITVALSGSNSKGKKTFATSVILLCVREKERGNSSFLSNHGKKPKPKFPSFSRMLARIVPNHNTHTHTNHHITSFISFVFGGCVVFFLLLSSSCHFHFSSCKTAREKNRE